MYDLILIIATTVALSEDVEFWLVVVIVSLVVGFIAGIILTFFGGGDR